MRVAVLQDRFGVDGRSRVIARVMELLEGSGHRTTMFTRSTPEEVTQAWRTMHAHHPALRLDVQQVRVPLPKRRASLYSTMICNLLVSSRLCDYDVVFNSNNYLFVGLTGPMVINYVHFPPYASTQLPPRLRGTFGRAYRLPLYALRLIDRCAMQHPRARIIANSHHTAHAIRTVHPNSARDILVLYPPVTPSCTEWPQSRDVRRVLTLGRIHPDKRIDKVLELARSLRHLSFTLIGSVDSPRYLRRIQHELVTRRMNHVRLILNAPASQIDRLLNESSVLLHTAAEEQFGIAICEAMAAGTIPVVPNSAGPAEIVRDPALRYDSLGEAREILLRLSRGQDLQALRNMLRRDADARFHVRHFDRTLTAVLEGCHLPMKPAL